LASKQKSVRSSARRSSGFRNLLWEFNVAEIETNCSQINKEDGIYRLHKEGFNNLRVGFEEFLTKNNLNYNNTGYFKIYSSVAVESTDIIRTSGSFYGNEWFSNVSITSEETVWYGKVYIYIYIFFLIFIIESIINFKIYNVIDLIFRHFYYWNFLIKRTKIQ